MLSIKNNLRHEQCPLCHAKVLSKVGSINYFKPIHYSNQRISLQLTPELWKCTVCKSSFIQNAILEAESIHLYKQGCSDKRYAKTSCEQPKTKVVTKTLEQFIEPGIRVLDIGCNTGEILDFFKQRKCETFGVEYSQSSLDHLREKGHSAYSNINEVDGCFDLIIAFDLVEHIYALPNFLDACLEKLSSTGYLILLTGNINCFWSRITRENWWYVRYPEHIIFPSKNFFLLYPKLEIVDWIPTYADSCYERPKIKVFLSIIKSTLKGYYSGLPSLGSDHILIVLKPSVSSHKNLEN